MGEYLQKCPEILPFLFPFHVFYGKIESCERGRCRIVKLFLSPHKYCRLKSRFDNGRRPDLIHQVKRIVVILGIYCVRKYVDIVKIKILVQFRVASARLL